MFCEKVILTVQRFHPVSAGLGPRTFSVGVWQVVSPMSDSEPGSASQDQDHPGKSSDSDRSDSDSDSDADSADSSSVSVSCKSQDHCVILFSKISKFPISFCVGDCCFDVCNIIMGFVLKCSAYAAHRFPPETQNARLAGVQVSRRP